jgi:hypothetical protein
MKIIHIGHHKCASTFLQWEVFPKIKKLKTITLRKELGGIPEKNEWFLYLVRTADMHYDPQKVEPQFVEYAAQYNCISYEGFTGHGLMEMGSCHQIEPIAARLHHMFPEAQILFVIRNQKTFIPSWYRADVTVGFVPKFEKWFRRRQEFSMLDWCKYAGIIQTYQKYFGEDVVKVVLYEDLFQTETIGGILEDLDISEEGIENVDFNKRINAGLSRPNIFLTRQVNRMFGSKVNFGQGRVFNMWRKYIRFLEPPLKAMKLRPPNYDFPGYEDLMKDLYHENNKITSALIGVDLSERGYP